MSNKRTILVVAAFMVVLFLANPHKSLAQAGDTLVVYANGPSIDEVISADTTNSGVQAHQVYKLVSRDTTYLWLGPITVRSNFEVIGVLGSDGRPPCIQAGVLGDGSLPYYLFVVNGAHTVATFKNLYLTGRAPNNTINALNVNGIGSFIQVSGDSAKLYVDNVIFEDMPNEAIGYTGNYDDFYITNCKFRNLISATAWYSGEGLRNAANVATADTIIMDDNTFIAVNCYDVCPIWLTNYLQFDHNTDIFSFTGPPLGIWEITNGKIDNNMFYGSWCGGITYLEYIQFWNEVHSLAISSIIDLDTLTEAQAKAFDPADSANPNALWLAEAKRTIEVKNNNYFMPDTVLGFWKAYDDTAHGDDSLMFPTWMNDRTAHMFNTPTQWPGMVEKGNTFVDPGFGPSIDNMLYPNEGDGVGIFKCFMNIRGNTASTDVYGYQIQNVTGSNWIPQWPLPELQDMQYSNGSLKIGGTDGKPVGDMGWFSGGYTGVPKTPAQAPSKFALHNAYPNPFNPSTTIKVSLAHSGMASLEIYNVLGQLVRVVDQGFKQPGEYIYNVNMDNLSSGVYFYRLEQGSQMITKKMLLLK